MKTISVLFAMATIYLLCTSTQCNPCHAKDKYLNEGDKHWLPVRGTVQLLFADSTGSTTSVISYGTDTIVTNVTECGDTYKREYITNVLYLNNARTDSIYLDISSWGILSARAISNGNYNFSMFDVKGKAKEGIQAKRVTNFTTGGRTYIDVIIIFHSSNLPDTIDSVLLANNAGIVGFKYYGKHYWLK